MKVNEVIHLCRLASRIADRFERLGVDELGAMEPADKKLLEAVRKQIDKVLTQ